MEKLFSIMAVLVVSLIIGCDKNNITQNNVIPESQNNQQQEITESSDKTAYTNEQLIEMVKKYRTDKGKYIPEFVEVDGENGDIVNIHLYDVMEENIATSDWYFINKYTGKGTNILNEEVDLV